MADGRETGRETAAPQRKAYVWDLPVRVFHWSLVALVLSAWITGGTGLRIHEVGGYVVTALVLFRLGWGFMGTPHALFADFVRTPGHVLRYMMDLLHGRSKRHLGHNPAGGAMVVAILGLLSIICTTGVMQTTNRYFGVEWVENLHAFAADTLMWLVPLHLLGVIVSSLVHRENLVAAMITGEKLLSPHDVGAERPRRLRRTLLIRLHAAQGFAVLLFCIASGAFYGWTATTKTVTVHATAPATAVPAAPLPVAASPTPVESAVAAMPLPERRTAPAKETEDPAATVLTASGDSTGTASGNGPGLEDTRSAMPPPPSQRPMQDDTPQIAEAAAIPLLPERRTASAKGTEDPAAMVLTASGASAGTANGNGSDLEDTLSALPPPPSRRPSEDASTRVAEAATIPLPVSKSALGLIVEDDLDTTRQAALELPSRKLRSPPRPARTTAPKLRQAVATAQQSRQSEPPRNPPARRKSVKGASAGVEVPITPPEASPSRETKRAAGKLVARSKSDDGESRRSQKRSRTKKLIASRARVSGKRKKKLWLPGNASAFADSDDDRSGASGSGKGKSGKGKGGKGGSGNSGKGSSGSGDSGGGGGNSGSGGGGSGGSGGGGSGGSGGGGGD